MTDPALQAQIEAATAYETLFVPAIFEEWAPRVVAAASLAPGHHVLDVACGTGVLARAAAAHVGEGGRVTALDPIPGMLAVAERVAPHVEWRRGVAEDLPFENDSFDACVSQFGLMFFTDRVGALREMKRVVRPGGRVAVAVWDSLENTPLYAEEVALLDRLAGSAAGDALRAPFVLGDPRELESLFTEAGFDDVKVTTQTGVGDFPSLRTLVEADLRGWLPVMGVPLSEEKIAEILAAADSTLARWVTPDGRLRFESPAHIVSGKA
ncbi:MAG: methyltransferase domain-containing protein [Gemmatimonadetes bacterium]|nr:methyltransferase domain-containing protein [Gemmatimonadota bacterium]